MYIDSRITQELKDIDVRCTRINNMLVTPLQNNMTDEKEMSLKAELKYLYKRKEQIYNKLIDKMEKE